MGKQPWSSSTSTLIGKSPSSSEVTTRSSRGATASPKIVQHLANGLSGDLLRALPDDRRPDGATLLATLVQASDERGERVTMQPPHPSSPAERLAWMDTIGIDHCLVNPGSWWQLLEYLGPDRPQGAAICNDWLAEQIADGGHRLHGVAVVDFTDLDATVAEMERARAKGHRAFFLYTLDGRPPRRRRPAIPSGTSCGRRPRTSAWWR